ncbi:MAG: type II toxin-antitoxin system Phd/YefM family antitoxin [Terriglobales bacterium]
MEKIGLFDAKTHLAALVQRVERGEEFVLTRHGAPVARLGPLGAPMRPDRAEIMRRAQQLRTGRRLAGVSIRDLIHSGRKR